MKVGAITKLGTPKKARGAYENLSPAERKRLKNEAQRAYYAIWAVENPESYNAMKARRRANKRKGYAKNKEERSDAYRVWLNTRAEQLRDLKYGLIPGQWAAMLIAQSGRCGICQRPMKSPHVDHDHDSGKVRELLCGDCNRGLGGFKDRRAILFQAIAYLARHGR